MRSVRARLALIFVGLTAGILCVFSTSIYLLVRERWDAELERNLQTELTEFIAHFQDEYDEFQRGIYKDLAPELDDFTRLSGTLTEVRRADGSLLHASKGFEPVVTENRVRAQLEAAPYRGVVQHIRTPKGEEFSVAVAVSEQTFQAHLAQMRLYFAVFCPLILAVSWLVGYLFVGRALSPVEEMRRLAERISRENLAERISVPRSTGEFRDLACTLNETLDRLARAIEDLQTFAADASHELRTPLSNLRAQFDTLVQEPRPAEEYERAIGSFCQDLDRMNRIVADLFTLAKIDMRQYALQREPVRLSSVLAEVRDTWEAPARERGVEIDILGGDAVVAGDPAALRRVVMNLVENAVKYNRPGGGISLSVEKSNGVARVRVADTGIGIAAEHLPQLFKRFFRVDKARSRDSGGAGLGLAICKSFVEAHEGKINLTSTVGRGTDVVIELPVDGSDATGSNA